jgi:hypothetical protein
MNYLKDIEPIEHFFFIFKKIKENYNTVMTINNINIINNNSMKNKFINMGYDNNDADCMTLTFMFYIYISMCGSLD